MTELRKRFEELAYKNKWNICKYPKSDYHNKEGEYCDDFVNGAWWAFQEQQKKIDLFNKMILSLRNEFNLWADDTEPFDAIEAQIENLEELLK